jgi:hypothetical protein
MFYLIKGIKRIITDYVIGSELSKLILELENKKNILDNDKIFEEYDTKTTIYSNQNLVVTYRKTLEDKLLVKNTEPSTDSDNKINIESNTEPNKINTEPNKINTEPNKIRSDSDSSTESESSTENKNTKVGLTVDTNIANKKKSKYCNKFRKMAIQQNKTICFSCGRDTHKQNECTETIDIYGSLLL